MEVNEWRDTSNRKVKIDKVTRMKKSVRRCDARVGLDHDVLKHVLLTSAWSLVRAHTIYSVREE